MTYVFAAGNDSVDECSTFAPADVAEGITVGATTKTDAQAFYSSFGPCLDLYAPGGDGLFTGVVSDSNASDTATTSKSGTSMAAPHVAGAAALYLQANPSATPAQVAGWVTRNATPGPITSLGSGSANLLHTAQPMIAALRRLGGLQTGGLPDAVKTFGISSESGLAQIFATHPPIEVRIAALRG